MKLMLSIFGLIVWILAVVFGTINLAKYQSQPGREASPPASIDSQTAEIKFDGRNPTLLLFAHPKCPCTRASLTELSELIDQYGARMTVYILFYQPEDEPADWSQTDVWKQASEMTQAHVLTDVGGGIAKRFDAHTSGQVMLYSSSGNLVFKGGITAGRGHVGRNSGVDAIADYFEKGSASNVKTTNVFGCIIDRDDSDS